MYCIRFSLVTGISDPFGIRSIVRETPKSKLNEHREVSEQSDRTRRARPTFVCDSKVERKILLYISRISFEFEETSVKFRIERSEIVEVALLAKPLRDETIASVSLCELEERQRSSPWRGRKQRTERR
jgi:hypothetical protein